MSPFATIYQIDLREQQRLEGLEALANNGLAVTLGTSVLFHPLSGELFQLKTQVAPDYYDVLIAPVLRSSARKVIGRYTPEEIYERLHLNAPPGRAGMKNACCLRQHESGKVLAWESSEPATVCMTPASIWGGRRNIESGCGRGRFGNG